ncbi:hypothetical protein L195_g000003 [Trifolium pratense]|uniref:Uncharacterized protein n=1 Tax=Trifolium pratense TaxID=57577 RepID=A0A2K3NKN2_TRIPR|nr:hypothetical protein L195_g000003 [Trifolium pratense]
MQVKQGKDSGPGRCGRCYFSSSLRLLLNQFPMPELVLRQDMLLTPDPVPPFPSAEGIKFISGLIGRLENRIYLIN